LLHFLSLKIPSKSLCLFSTSNCQSRLLSWLCGLCFPLIFNLGWFLFAFRYRHAAQLVRPNSLSDSPADSYPLHQHRPATAIAFVDTPASQSRLDFVFLCFSNEPLPATSWIQTATLNRPTSKRLSHPAFDPCNPVCYLDARAIAIEPMVFDNSGRFKSSSIRALGSAMLESLCATVVIVPPSCPYSITRYINY